MKYCMHGYKGINKLITQRFSEKQELGQKKTRKASVFLAHFIPNTGKNR